mgnify:CR=1 FL=1
MGGNDWFATESGQNLAAMAAGKAGIWLEHLVGHNALILQPCTQGLPVPALRFQSLTRLERARSRFYGDFQADDADLPLSSDCMALVYAAFVLETSPHPAALLREFERLLLAEGHLAILALNPFSHVSVENGADWNCTARRIGRMRCKLPDLNCFAGNASAKVIDLTCCVR